MGSTNRLSTALPSLSTAFWDKYKALTSTFTIYPQKRAIPITTIFIYKYLSPQANLWVNVHHSAHSFNPYLYAKLSNLEGFYRLTNEMRASA